MDRRQFLALGAVASGAFVLGGPGRLGRTPAGAQPVAVPTVDRLVMTNVVDNIYDIFAKAGRLDTITVERTGPRGGRSALWNGGARRQQRWWRDLQPGALHRSVH